MPRYVDNMTDLVFSPDDETETGKGWYLQQYKRSLEQIPLDRTSQLFSTAEEALQAYRDGTVEWGEWD